MSIIPWTCYVIIWIVTVVVLFIHRLRLLGFVFFVSTAATAVAQNEAVKILERAKIHSPKATLVTFLSAMNEYRLGAETKNQNLHNKIELATRTLDLSEIPPLLRREKALEAAVFLKEVIDRLGVTDLSQVPDTNDSDSYRIRGTEIIISRQTEGPNTGDYLFSAQTVAHAKESYNLVKHLDYAMGSGQGALYQDPWIERQIPKWSKGAFFGLFRWQWLGLFLCILFGLFARRLAHVLLGTLRKWSEKSRVDWDEQVLRAIERPAGLLVLSGLWFFSINLLRLDGLALELLTLVVQLLFSISLIWGVYRLTAVLTEYLKKLALKSDSTIDDQLVPMLTKAIRLFILVFGVLLAIQNLGVNVMSLLAGLGLGGLAFALAAKDTAANLFGSITILWDQPFKVGDWIIVAGVDGNVEEIGFRSTRIRTFYNSEISIPNSIVANSHIDNMGRRRYRRVKTTVGLTYDTPAEKLEAFLEGVKQIILAHPHTRKDYFHVVFHQFGASSLDILLYFFIKAPDWSRELVGRQNVLLEILRLAERLEVSFAFPSQSVYVETMPGHAHESKKDWDSKQLISRVQEFAKDGERSMPEGLGIFVPPYKSK